MDIKPNAFVKRHDKPQVGLVLEVENDDAVIVWQNGQTTKEPQVDLGVVVDMRRGTGREMYLGTDHKWRKGFEKWQLVVDYHGDTKEEEGTRQSMRHLHSMQEKYFSWAGAEVEAKNSE